MNKEHLRKFENGEIGNTWRDWIIAQTLQSEATRVINDEDASAAPPVNLPR
jgi:hypothetical protein